MNGIHRLEARLKERFSDVGVISTAPVNDDENEIRRLDITRGRQKVCVQMLGRVFGVSGTGQETEKLYGSEDAAFGAAVEILDQPQYD